MLYKQLYFSNVLFRDINVFRLSIFISLLITFFCSFTVSHNHDDSSEDELFSRKSPLKGSPNVKERVALLKLSPQAPSASKYLPDQLTDNMCHNPGTLQN